MQAVSADFAQDVRRLKALYVALLDLQLVPRLSFEARFQLLRLHFPLELVSREAFDLTTRGDYRYCFYVNKNRVCHLPLTGPSVWVAQKIKAECALSPPEKILALQILRQLDLELSSR